MIRRSGNFGIVESPGGELYSFSIGARSSEWTPSRISLRGGSVSKYGWKYMTVNGRNIIPYGPDNDMPGRVQSLLERFYAGEGIMGKKAGLQWGEGPRLYRDAIDGNNVFYRQWLVDPVIEETLRRSDYMAQMQRCLVDLCHLEGFWVRVYRSRGYRVDERRTIARIEHVPASKVRFIWEGDNIPPKSAMYGDWPNPGADTSKVYPLFDPSDPLRHPVSLAYFSLPSFNHDHYSVPRYIGAFDWLELAGTLARLLMTYNRNASAISKHIESPQSYWNEMEQNIKAQCEQQGIAYRDEMLEDFKDAAMERFASALTGTENAGKFFHTPVFWNPDADKFEGWKITPIDNKIKEYIDAQMSICKKAEAAATSGFGLDPSLSNLILDTKLGSGSEKLYALKVYNATETAMPDALLCRPWQILIDSNHPGTDVRIGLYRSVVEAEKNVAPEDRVKANA